MTPPIKVFFISAGLLIISAVASAQPRPRHHPVKRVHHVHRVHRAHHVHHVAHRRVHHAPPHH